MDECLPNTQYGKNPLIPVEQTCIQQTLRDVKRIRERVPLVYPCKKKFTACPLRTITVHCTYYLTSHRLGAYYFGNRHNLQFSRLSLAYNQLIRLRAQCMISKSNVKLCSVLVIIFFETIYNSTFTIEPSCVSTSNKRPDLP